MQGIGEKWESGDYVGAVLDGIQAAVGAKRMLQACFAAGTKLKTPGGWKAIEEFAVGDVLLSRDEWDAGRAVEAKGVEEVFVRTGRVAGLHIGGRVIRTTLEHPFWCVGRGWVACGELRPGDVLIGSDGTPVAVEEVFDENQYETVYNLRIADHHTYFVGDEGWGFDVWSHNQCHPRDVGKAVGKGKIDKQTAKAVSDAINAGGKKNLVHAAKLLADNVDGVGKVKSAQLVSSIVQQLKANPRTYQTYTKVHKNGTIYVGRASGSETPLKNIARRERGGHDWTKRGYGPAKLDRTTTSYASVRGREQLLKDYYTKKGRNVEGDGGIRPRNKRRQAYIDAARAEFGDI